MRRVIALVLVIAVSGCAQSVPHQQLQAMPTADGIKYDQDVPACVNLSPNERLAWRVLQGAAIGVSFGAGIGAIAGGYAAAGNTVPALWQGAAAGAGAGALAGGVDGYQDLKKPADGCGPDGGAPVAKQTD